VSGRIAKVAGAALLAATLAGCEIGAPRALTREALANAQYGSEWVAGGVVTLTDGQFGTQAGPGSRLRMSVRLSEWWAVGDLDSDGVDEAAAVLVTQTGGAATFVDLAVMRNRRGRPRFLTGVNLGDRVRVDGLAVRDGVVEVKLVQHGDADDMCCPTEHVTYRWELIDGALVPLAE